MGRELRELNSDLFERQSDPLREDDEGDAAEYGAWKAPVARVGSLRAYEASLLVEAEGGSSDAASARDLTDSQQVGSDHKFRRRRGLTSS